MGSESIAHEAAGWLGYWLGGHEGERNNCLSKIQLVGKKISRQNNFCYLKLDFNLFLPPKSWRFSLLVGYNTPYSLVVAHALNQSERSIDNRPLVGFYQVQIFLRIVPLVCTVGYCMVKIRGYHHVGQSSLQYYT